MSEDEYRIIIKLKDKDHVEKRIKDRLSVLYLVREKELIFQEIYHEIKRALRTAKVINSVPEKKLNRCKKCKDQKFFIHNWSELLGAEIEAIVFQDEENKIRYVLNVMEPTDGFLNQYEYR